MCRQPSPFAVWFEVTDHADVLLNISIDHAARGPSSDENSLSAWPAAETEKSAEAVTTPAGRSYHCHGVILSTYSGYFKAQLSSAWQQPREAEEASRSSSAAGTRRTVSVHVEAEELDAMHELLRMVYSQAPPTAAAPGEPLFLQCLSLADRFQAVSCMELLVAALADSPSEAINCAVLGYVFQASASVKATPSYPGLLASSTKALVRLFGNVPEVIKDEALLQRFCSLPYAVVLAWVQSDELQVHSENCVVFLVSAWVKANQDSTAAQHEELAHQIRVFHLGPAYQHHILPNLSWFKDCSSMKDLPAVLFCIRAGITMQQGQAKENRIKDCLSCAPAWMAKPRGHSNSPRTGSWVVSSSQLKEMENGTGQYLSPPVYVNGFLMWIYMAQAATAPSAVTPGKTLGVYRGISRALMAQGGLPVPDSIMLPIGPVSVQVGSPNCQLSKESNIGFPFIMQCGRVWGPHNFFGSSAESFLELVSPYLWKGQLQVEATFTGVDIAL